MEKIVTKEYVRDILQRSIFMILIFLVTYFCARMGNTDYPDHLTFLPTEADLLHPLRFFLTSNPEPLWHFCTVLLRVIFQIPFGYAGPIVSGLCNLVCFEMIRRYFLQYAGKYASCLSFAVLFAGSLYIPWLNSYFYFGTGSPNVWHNPTIVMARPFAIIIMLRSMQIMDTPFLYTDYRAKLKDMVTLSVLILCSVFAKPAFAQVFFPAILIFCIGKIFASKGRFFPNSVFLLICCIPALCIFLLQFFICFFSGSPTLGNGPAISIKFLYVMRIFSPNPYPFSTQILVIGFPLVVLVSKLIRKSKFSNSYIISWLMYLIGLAEYSLFVENARPSYGNFGWGLILGSFFVFLEAAKELCTMIPEENNGKEQKTFSTCMFLLLCHLFSGAIWIYRIIFLNNYQ